LERFPLAEKLETGIMAHMWHDGLIGVVFFLM